MSIDVVQDDLSGALARVSSGDCAIEIEHYPGVGVNILINTPPTSEGETEELELWVHDDGRFIIERHHISGKADEGIILESCSATLPPDNVLILPRRPS